MKIQMNKKRMLEEFSGLDALADRFHNGLENIKDKLSPVLDGNDSNHSDEKHIPFADRPLTTKENNPFRTVFK